MAKLSDNSRDFFTRTHGAVLASGKEIDRARKCGTNAGIGFELKHGQTIEFFSNEETFLKFKEFKKSEILFVSCEINGKPQWLPVWTLRKKPVRREEFTSEMESNQLYMTLQQESDNDWARVELLLGKDGKGGKYTVSEYKIETSKDDKSFEVKVWTLEKVTTSSGRGRNSNR